MNKVVRVVTIDVDGKIEVKYSNVLPNLEGYRGKECNLNTIVNYKVFSKASDSYEKYLSYKDDLIMKKIHSFLRESSKFINVYDSMSNKGRPLNPYAAWLKWYGAWSENDPATPHGRCFIISEGKK